MRGSIQPVDNLFSETLKQFQVETQKTTPKYEDKILYQFEATTKRTTPSESDISDILDILRDPEPDWKSETTSTVGSEADQSTKPSTIYFDPVHNTRPVLNSRPHSVARDKSTPATPSLTEFLNSQLQNQFETENPEDFKTSHSRPAQAQTVNKTTTSQVSTNGSTSVTTQNFETKTSSSSDLSSSTKTNPNPIEPDSTTTQTTTTTLPLEVVQTTPESGTTQSTTLATEKTTRAKLSPADYLKLCFISQIGCDFDFSQNEVDNSTAVPTTTTRRPPAITRSPLAATTEISAERVEELRQRVQACFLTGVCEDGDSRPDVEEEVEERVTETPRIGTTPDYASDIQRVQEKARACFFQGKCN